MYVYSGALHVRVYTWSLLRVGHAVQSVRRGVTHYTAHFDFCWVRKEAEPATVVVSAFTGEFSVLSSSRKRGVAQMIEDSSLPHVALTTKSNDEVLQIQKRTF